MKLEIPKITDERLNELVKRIKPVVRDSNNALVYIKQCDLRKEAFTWAPVLMRRATRLVKYATIKTLHTYGYYGMFKPSIAEVIAQIPSEFLDNTIAFETIGPSDAKELNQQMDAVNAGFHLATTHLYANA